VVRDLRQAILADDYRGRCLRLSGELKSAGMDERAGLSLRMVDPATSGTPEERQQILVHGTRVEACYENTIDTPADSVFILFGISLTGPGQLWVTNVELDAVG
jgi:hypothetical protein